MEAGLLPGSLITHINDEAVQSLLNSEVIRLVLKGSVVNVRCVPLESTTIQRGGKRRSYPGKMARKSSKKRQDKQREKKSGRSLLRRLSSKSKKPDWQTTSPLGRTYTNSAFSKSWSGESGRGLLTSTRSLPSTMPYSPDSNSSTSSSPSSSTPNSPASSSQYGRPSSLHGLKHTKRTHAVSSLKSPHRRKSVHNIPLSPLARTPSPSPMPTSPTTTRSPSPLAFSQGHQIGSSNMTQHTIPCLSQHFWSISELSYSKVVIFSSEDRTWIAIITPCIVTW